jgi:hypothetical protein
MVDIARITNSGPFCSGPSYPDGKCPTKGAPAAKADSQIVQNTSSAAPASKSGGNDGFRPSQESESPTPPTVVMPLLLFGLVALGLFKPKLLRALFGHLEPLEIDRRKSRADSVEIDEDILKEKEPRWNVPPPLPSAPVSPPVFGRRRA